MDRDPTAAARAVQMAVAVPLLVPPLAGKPAVGLFIYYGVVVAVLPGVVGVAAGQRLTATQRLAVSVGIGLHGHGLLLDLYPSFWWWDTLTHVVSAGLLAAGAYVVALTVARRRGLPLWTVHAAAFVVVIGGGLVWEVYEVLAPWQTVYPTGDAISDLLADAVGWAVVARVHPRLVGDLPQSLAGRIDDRTGSRSSSAPVARD